MQNCYRCPDASQSPYMDVMYRDIGDASASIDQCRFGALWWSPPGRPLVLGHVRHAVASGSARTVTCDPAWLTVCPPHSSRKSRCRHKAVRLALLVPVTTSQPAFRPANLSDLADPKHSRIPRDRISTVHRLRRAAPPQPFPVMAWA